jgi:hypothetical protein
LIVILGGITGALGPQVCFVTDGFTAAAAGWVAEAVRFEEDAMGCLTAIFAFGALLASARGFLGGGIGSMNPFLTTTGTNAFFLLAKSSAFFLAFCSLKMCNRLASDWRFLSTKSFLVGLFSLFCTGEASGVPKLRLAENMSCRCDSRLFRK